MRAQPAPHYPQGYFRNPLDIPILLAGNFGECRPNHFHSGLDIKTQGKENLPVYAAADGYVSRIKMEPGGFGHALYITHPNGYITLYAHLNDFAPDIQRYLHRKQYEQQNWKVDLQLSPTQFPVKQGERIAWSGNTGGSGGPHLHFEIRDSQTEHPLNPQLFGFEINDTRAPVPTQLAVYNLNESTYTQKPQLIPLRKTEAGYVVAGDTVTVPAGLTGVGVNVNDYMNGSDNTLNFYEAVLYAEDRIMTRILLDDIGYDVTRYLHAYADYKTKKQTGEWVQCLFRLPGNNLLHIYENLNAEGGAIAMQPDEVIPMRITLTDAAGNSSTISFILKAVAATTSNDCDNKYNAGEANSFENANVQLRLDNKALYDNMCFSFTKTGDAKSSSDRYTLGNSYVPLHTYNELRIKPNKPIPFALRNKVALAYTDGADETAKAAAYEKGWYTASIRNLGTYRLVADTTAPTLKPLQKNGANLSTAQTIRFVSADAMTSVKIFKAVLDGKQWLCFEQNGSTYSYKFDEYCPKGKHELVVTATDENDNTRTLRFTFTR